MGVDKLAAVSRRMVRADGVVVDESVVPGEVIATGGRVMSLQPPLVRLLSGDTVTADAYLRTGVTPAVGDDVAVVIVGAFVLVLGKVVPL